MKIGDEFVLQSEYEEAKRSKKRTLKVFVVRESRKKEVRLENKYDHLTSFWLSIKDIRRLFLATNGHEFQRFLERR